MNIALIAAAILVINEDTPMDLVQRVALTKRVADDLQAPEAPVQPVHQGVNAKLPKELAEGLEALLFGRQRTAAQAPRDKDEAFAQMLAELANVLAK